MRSCSISAAWCSISTSTRHLSAGPVTPAASLRICSGDFREIFLSSIIGLRKPDAAAYDHVVKAIGVPAHRIVFFDDLAENIEGAQARGLTAVHVTSPEDVADALAALGI